MNSKMATASFLVHQEYIIAATLNFAYAYNGVDIER